PPYCHGRLTCLSFEGSWKDPSPNRFAPGTPPHNLLASSIASAPDTNLPLPGRVALRPTPRSLPASSITSSPNTNLPSPGGFALGPSQRENQHEHPRIPGQADLRPLWDPNLQGHSRIFRRRGRSRCKEDH